MATTVFKQKKNGFMTNSFLSFRLFFIDFCDVFLETFKKYPIKSEMKSSVARIFATEEAIL